MLESAMYNTHAIIIINTYTLTYTLIIMANISRYGIRIYNYIQTFRPVHCFNLHAIPLIITMTFSTQQDHELSEVCMV